MKILMICTPTQYFSGDKMEKNEMGGAYSTHGKRRGMYSILVGNLKEWDHLGDPSVNGKLLLRWIFRMWDVEYGLDPGALG